MTEFVPPVCARDVIEFSPAAERVALARQALALAHAEAGPAAEPAALQAAETALAEAEAAQAERDVSYRLRPPTLRSKSAANRDTQAEGVIFKTNPALLDHILGDAGLEAPARGFIEEVKDYLPKLGHIHDDDWKTVEAIAATVAGASKIIADRLHHNTLFRLHMLRHHLLVAGQRNPLPETVIDAIPVLDQFALFTKLSELETPTQAVAKNSDAP